MDVCKLEFEISASFDVHKINYSFGEQLMSITQLLNRSGFVAGAASLVGAVTLLVAHPVSAAGFSGDYDPSNFTLINDNADGFVDTTNAPLSVTLQGGNNGSGFPPGQTSYTTTAQGDGQVSFDFNYTTMDRDGPSFDPFGFLLNNVFTQLSDSSGPRSQSGSTSFLVMSGDIFGFAIQTVDNAFGPASVTISSFHAPASEPADVPEPASTLGLLALGAFGAGSALKRKQAKAA